MKRVLYILAAVLLLESCEIPFDIDTSGIPPRMFVECMAGGSDTTFMNIGVAVPVGEPRKEGSDYTVRKVSMLCNGTALNLLKDTQDKMRWSFASSLEEGSTLEFSLETDLTSPVHASTRIPVMPPFEVSSSLRDNILCYKLSFGKRTEGTSALAFAVKATAADEIPGMPEGIRENFCFLQTVKEQLGIIGALSQSFRTIDLPYRGFPTGASGIFLKWDDLYDDNILQFGVDYDPEANYTLYVYALSEEAYGYMNARYEEQNNAFGILGLAPPGFGYSNIASGYGILAGFSIREVKF